jgi:hypothetical protein
LRNNRAHTTAAGATSRRPDHCALAANAEFIVTMNTAPGHFDRSNTKESTVARPGEFLNILEVRRLVKKLARG